MPFPEKEKQLMEKLGEIDSLAQEEQYSSKFQIWDKVTTRLLAEVLDQDMLKVFTGILEVSSYASHSQSQRLYLDHLQKKKQALSSLIDYIKTM